MATIKDHSYDLHKFIVNHGLEDALDTSHLNTLEDKGGEYNTTISLVNIDLDKYYDQPPVLAAALDDISQEDDILEHEHLYERNELKQEQLERLKDVIVVNSDTLTIDDINGLNIASESVFSAMQYKKNSIALALEAIDAKQAALAAGGLALVIGLIYKLISWFSSTSSKVPTVKHKVDVQVKEITESLEGINNDLNATLPVKQIYEIMRTNQSKIFPQSVKDEIRNLSNSNEKEWTVDKFIKQVVSPTVVHDYKVNESSNTKISIANLIALYKAGKLQSFTENTIKLATKYTNDCTKALDINIRKREIAMGSSSTPVTDEESKFLANFEKSNTYTEFINNAANMQSQKPVPTSADLDDLRKVCNLMVEVDFGDLTEAYKRFKHLEKINESKRLNEEIKHLDDAKKKEVKDISNAIVQDLKHLKHIQTNIISIVAAYKDVVDVYRCFAKVINSAEKRKEEKED